MPMFNGYSIYIAAPSRQRATWLARAYRDSNDEHLHSAEDCDTLDQALREVNRVIVADVAMASVATTEEQRP